jgi:uncharacterized protein YbcI
MSETTQRAVKATGNLPLDIANAFVSIQKELYGRGPTKARAHVSREVVIIVARGGYSRAEQMLHSHGKDDAVEAGRRAMQQAAKPLAIAAVEELTGRTVCSFMSANDPDLELQAEIFLLDNALDLADPDDLIERARLAQRENRQVREELRALRAEQAQSRAAVEQRRHSED